MKATEGIVLYDAISFGPDRAQNLYFQTALKTLAEMGCL
ncbi:hypothetical protein BF49_2068 [Bradyrhizobium sp.]|nr:hypothetical protein BF49_2068 [Bradyrhizobium sp.]